MKQVLLVVALLGFVQLSFGWGEVGHKTIAEVASTLLTDEASALVKQFLGDRTLADIASIPDAYDHTWQGEWSKPCHFCNLPRDATNFTMKNCPGFCVVKSLFNYSRILEEEVSSGNITQCSFGWGDEPCALIFITHFAGDSHQPLHCGYGYDEGGNLVNVTFFGNHTELHACWDTWMILRWVPDYQTGAKELLAMMQTNNETSLIKEYQEIDNPIDWADESFAYVRSTCYNFAEDAYFMDDEFTEHQMEKGTVPAIGEAYYQRNLPIIKQRLIAAAIRLAQMLNRILI